MTGPHSQDVAVQAVVNAINLWRDNALAQAKADWVAANGGTAPDFPEDGPIIPKCRLDDPNARPEFSDAGFARYLGLFTPRVDSENVYSPKHVEGRLIIEIEWFFATTIKAFEQGHLRTLHAAGRKNIESALLEYPYFMIPGVESAPVGGWEILSYEDFTDNYGEFVAKNASIQIGLDLDMDTILS